MGGLAFLYGDRKVAFLAIVYHKRCGGGNGGGLNGYFPRGVIGLGGFYGGFVIDFDGSWDGGGGGRGIPLPRGMSIFHGGVLTYGMLDRGMESAGTSKQRVRSGRGTKDLIGGVWLSVRHLSCHQFRGGGGRGLQSLHGGGKVAKGHMEISLKNGPRLARSIVQRLHGQVS